jgi:hypothetical protein
VTEQAGPGKTLEVVVSVEPMMGGKAPGLGGKGPAGVILLPPDLRAELIELLASALLADMRKYPDLPMATDVTEASGVPPRGSELP